jgi:hypothetical protein
MAAGTLFLGILVGWAGIVSASSPTCRSKDISEKLGPIRDQGDSQFCYAFAAADLLTEAASIAPPNQVSAFQIAAGYINLSKEQLKEAKVSVSVSILNAQQNWKYNYGDLFSGVTIKDRVRGAPAIAMTQALNSKKLCLEKEVPSQGLPGDDRFLFRMIDKLTAEPAGTANCPYNSSDLRWTNSSIQGLVDAIYDEQAYRVKQYTDRACANPIIPPLLNVHRKSYVRNHFENGEISKSFDPDDEIRSDLSTLLCRGRPVAIDFDGCAAWDCAEGVQTAHTATIVGVKVTDDGNTQFKIRDSYGPNCKRLKPELKCQNGHYWIDSRSLGKVITSINWIEK